MIALNRLIESSVILDTMGLGISYRKMPILNKNDILIFPENPTIYTHPLAKRSKDYDYSKDVYSKCSFVVCKVLTCEGEVKEVPFYPVTFFMRHLLYLADVDSFYKGEKEIADFCPYESYFCNDLLDGQYYDLYDAEIDESEKDCFIPNTELLLRLCRQHLFGKTFLILKTGCTYVRIYDHHACCKTGRFKKICLYCKTLIGSELTEALSTFEGTHKIFELNEKYKFISQKYNSGLQQFVKEQGWWQLTSVQISKIVQSENIIQNYDYRIRVRKILKDFPFGVKTVFSCGLPNLNSLSGLEQILNLKNDIEIANAKYLQIQNEKAAIEKAKILEPKYRDSPCLGYILKSMDERQKDYYKCCTLVSVRYNPSMHSLLVIFAQDEAELFDYEFNDRYAYRTVLHFPSDIWLTYEKNCLKENIIRKIIDNVEKQNWSVHKSTVYF